MATNLYSMVQSFFKDYWNLFKKYQNVSSEDAYWEMLIKDSKELSAKYGELNSLTDQTDFVDNELYNLLRLLDGVEHNERKKVPAA